MPIMIRHAKISEITDIIAITKACTQRMIQKGIYQWNTHYPSPQIIENDIEREELYILELNTAIIGLVVITTLMDEEYMSIPWSYSGNNNLYIHRLAVHPNFQGQGYAQQLMNYAENFGRKNNYTSIRLDTFSQNQPNQNFYKKRGYRQVGSMFLPKQSTLPFYCFELIL